MSPAATFLTQAGFDRLGSDKKRRDLEIWHLRTSGHADIAVAIPADEQAGIDLAVRAIFSAGQQLGRSTMQQLWQQFSTAMTARVGHIGLPDDPAMPEGIHPAELEPFIDEPDGFLEPTP